MFNDFESIEGNGENFLILSLSQRFGGWLIPLKTLLGHHPSSQLWHLSTSSCSALAKVISFLLFEITGCRGTTLLCFSRLVYIGSLYRKKYIFISDRCHPPSILKFQVQSKRPENSREIQKILYIHDNERIIFFDADSICSRTKTTQEKVTPAQTHFYGSKHGCKKGKLLC